MSHIAAPVRVMKALGVETLLVTNACGGVNLDFQVGDLMVIDDHINFMGANPLTGPNDAGFGPRFCDMTYAYTPALRRLADEVAAAQGVALRHGVYLGYMGPSYETPAEIRAFRVLGAGRVGMSTVPEVIAASTAGCLCWPSASSPIWPRACWKRSWTKTRSSRRPQPAQRCWSAWSRESWSAVSRPEQNGMQSSSRRRAVRSLKAVNPNRKTARAQYGPGAHKKALPLTARQSLFSNQPSAPGIPSAPSRACGTSPSGCSICRTSQSHTPRGIWAV